MKIKTFPIQFTEDHLDKIRKSAADLNMSIKDFILSAIEEKIKRGE